MLTENNLTMENFRSFLNCSVRKDVFSLSNITNATIQSDTTKAVGLGTMTGILISLLINVALSFKVSWSKMKRRNFIQYPS